MNTAFAAEAAHSTALSSLSDLELTASFRELVVESQERLVEELEHVAELDRRKLFYHHASLRAYLVAEYGWEESGAERKIRIARLLRRLPELKAGLACGRLNLTLIEMAQGCAHRERLPDAELLELLEALSGLSCRSVSREIARRYPQSSEDAARRQADRIRPITGEHSEVRFIASEELLDKLEEIRGLLAQAHASSLSMAELIDVLATEYRERHHPEAKLRRAEERMSKKEVASRQSMSEVTPLECPTKSVDSPTAPWVIGVKQSGKQEAVLEPRRDPRTPSPAMVRELVRTQGYRCAYLDPLTQLKCGSQYALQVDHVHCWSKGGRTELTNLRFLCRNHHKRVSFLDFGEAAKFAAGSRAE